ncbi:MAG: NADP-dependent malic enzyme, partial [Rhodospirillales bacterium]|nr:NADP-dependent malic enzyme [Rhodospirillales bacterium]
VAIDEPSAARAYGPEVRWRIRQDDWQTYHQLLGRQGVSPAAARTVVRTRNTVIAALMVRRGEADGMICGVIGRYHRALQDIVDVIGLQDDVGVPAALSALISPRGTIFICDTHVSPDPGPAQIADMAVRASAVIRRFGMEPKAALLSHSNFGSMDTESSAKMRRALTLIEARMPWLEVEGEINAESAMNEDVRKVSFPGSRLRGMANLLVMPTLDAANIAFSLLKEMGGGQRVGPILLGTARPAHILEQSTTVRGIVNMTALCAVDAQEQAAARAAE